MMRPLRRLRGTTLVLLALPLAPALLFNLIGGGSRPVVGTLLGIGGTVLALRALRRGQQLPAAVLMGVATGLLAAMAGHVPILGAVVFGLMAGFGTALFYEGAPAPDPVAPPAAPLPPDPLALTRSRLAALAGGQTRLRPAVLALQDLLAEMDRQPQSMPEARRFLNIQLDGLERIAVRLGAGAAPPASLDALLAEMTQGSDSLRGRLRAAESEALDIQVKVLSDRLRQEGYA
jgi:hypothetical protein